MSEADVRLIINQVRNRADGDIRASDRWLLGHLVLDLLDLANHKRNTEGQMAKKPAKADPVAAKVAADLGLAEGQEPKPRYGSPSWSLKNNGLHYEVRYKDALVNAFIAKTDAERFMDSGEPQRIEAAHEAGYELNNEGGLVVATCPDGHEIGRFGTPILAWRAAIEDMDTQKLLAREPKPQPRQDGIVMTLKVRCVDLAALVATARAIRETMPDFGQEIIEFTAEIGHGTHDLHEL